jgi:hypothetical protein
MTQPIIGKYLTSEKDLIGVGGWLGLFCLGVVGSVIVTAVSTIKILRVLSQVADASVEHSMTVQVVARILLIAILTTGLWMIFRKRPKTRHYWLTVIPLTVVLVGLIWVTDLSVYQRVSELGGKVDPLNRSKMTGRMVRTVLWALIWTPYWFRSERVQMTFRRREPIA